MEAPDSEEWRMAAMLRNSAEWIRGRVRGNERERPSRRALFFTALRIGLVGFGGGLSVLSNIDDALVRRRRWLTPREYSHTITVAQMLPGGAAANALAFVGLRFGGWSGALLGYLGFVLPGMVSVLVLSVVYAHFGAIPAASQVLAGFNAAVVGIIVAIALKMVRTAVAMPWQMAVAAGALLLCTVGSASPGEVVLLSIFVGVALELGARRALPRALGALGVSRHRVALPEDGSELGRAHPALEPPPTGPSSTASSPVLVGVLTLGLVFLHAGGLDARLAEMAVVYFRTGLGAYGGGFAVIPHLKAMVASHGWATDRQFTDAVAIGKLTPGPVLLMATCLGYLQQGLAGALVATVSIFAAPFLLVVLLGTWLDRMRSRRWVRSALRGLTPAVVGLMAGAAITLGSGFQDRAEIGIAAAAALTLARFPVNPVWMLVLGGGIRVVLGALGV
jgi:chromate transporter